MAVRRSFLALNITNPVVEARNGIEALDRLRGRNGYEMAPAAAPRDARSEHAAHGWDRVPGRIARGSGAAPHPGVRDYDVGGGGGSALKAYDMNVAGYMLKHRPGQSFLKAIEHAAALLAGDRVPGVTPGGAVAR